LAVAVVSVVVLAPLSFVVSHADYGLTFGDSVSFHLPVVARWIQDGLWHPGEFLPLLPTGSYPGTGNLVFLGCSLPWHSFAFVRLVPLPFLALAGLGTYVAGRELGAPPPAAIAGAALLVATKVLGLAAVRALPDPICIAMFVAGVAFLVRAERTRARSDLVLAGLSLGLAFGTKWYGMTSVAVVVAAWALWRTGGLRRRRGQLAAVATPVLVIALVGGIWLLRNWVVYGNPLQPATVRLLGVTVFLGPDNVVLRDFGPSIAHYLGQGSIIADTILPQVRGAFGSSGLVLLAGAVATVILLGRRRGPVRFVLALTVLLAVTYVFTPATAQGLPGHPSPILVFGNSRALLPAAAAAAALVAWVAARSPRWGTVVLVVTYVAVIRSLDDVYEITAPTLLWVSLLAGVVAAALRLPRVSARALAGAAVVAVVVTGGLLYRAQRGIAERTAARTDATALWLTTEAPSGHRVGIAGEVYANSHTITSLLYGPRIGNRVRVVAPLVRGVLGEYRSSAPFRRSLRGLDLLAIGRGAFTDLDEAQLAWAHDDGFVEVAQSPSWTLLRRAAPG
ncbi:MAG: hypothetical protein QOI80_1938, partial [Solirubrobacteraceae bacterium]|nr:hypothetical protein [Solirubrobacteraceae bacterium]